MKLKIQPNFEKARSIKKMVSKRRKFINQFRKNVFTTIICENYYEIIKELATALFFCKGLKFIEKYAHKELIEEVIKLMNLDRSFYILLEDLRSRRNGSFYYGEEFEDIYLVNNESKIKFIIDKLESLLEGELKNETTGI